MEQRIGRLEESLHKILDHISDIREVKDMHADLVEDINNLSAKLDKVYIDVASRELKIQKELDNNTLLLKEDISNQRDEVKTLITNRLIWIIGVTLTGVMLVVQHFEGLHSISIDRISKDITNISITVENNKMLSKAIDINLKNLSTRVDRYNKEYQFNRMKDKE